MLALVVSQAPKKGTKNKAQKDHYEFRSLGIITQEQAKKSWLAFICQSEFVLTNWVTWSLGTQSHDA
jgi:hypothetical protein